jgi:hypothetical protein
MWLRLAFSKGPNRVGVFLPSPEDENISNFQNVVLSSYLKLRTMDKVALVRERTMQTERSQLVGEASANFCG